MNYWNVDIDNEYYSPRTSYTPSPDTIRYQWAEAQVTAGRNHLTEPKFFDIPVRFIIISGFYASWDVYSTSVTPVPITPERTDDVIKILNLEYGGWAGCKIRFFKSQHRADNGVASISPTADNRYLWYYRNTSALTVSGISVTNEIGNGRNEFPYLLQAYGDPRCLNIIINPMHKSSNFAGFATGEEWAAVYTPRYVDYMTRNPSMGDYAPVLNSGVFVGNLFIHEIGHETNIGDDNIEDLFSSNIDAQLSYRTSNRETTTYAGYSGLLSPLYYWMIEHSLNYVAHQTTYRNGFMVDQTTGCNPLYSASGEIVLLDTHPFVNIAWDRVVFNKLGYIIFPNDYEIYSRASSGHSWSLRDTIDAETLPGIFPSGYIYNSTVTDLQWKIIPRTTDAEWSWRASGTDAHWWNYINYSFDRRFSANHSVSGIYSFDYR